MGHALSDTKNGRRMFPCRPSSNLSVPGTVARLGGDEFAILLSMGGKEHLRIEGNVVFGMRGYAERSGGVTIGK